MPRQEPDSSYRVHGVSANSKRRLFAISGAEIIPSRHSALLAVLKARHIQAQQQALAIEQGIDDAFDAALPDAQDPPPLFGLILNSSLRELTLNLTIPSSKYNDCSIYSTW